MIKNPAGNETIELALPLNGAYVSAARLTAASIANRLGFDVDEIEDLKAAVAEACIFIIKNSPVDFRGTFAIAFILGDNLLEVKISANTLIDFELADSEMGIMMIRALMDDIAIKNENNNSTTVSMIKKHKHTAF